MAIPYELKTSTKARHVRITIYPEGRVVVTKPARVSVAHADEFVRSKSDWIQKKVNFQKNRTVIPIGNIVANKSDALAFVKSRVAHFNQHYQFQYNRVSVKNHKSLWGSCSARKNLNFNQRIVLLSPAQADYIIVHELCHLQEMNHSKKFWDLVAQTIPSHQLIRKELRSYSFQ